MTLQKRNADLVRLLIQDLQKRNEPNFAMAKTLSVMSLLPGLRGLWTFSSFDENGDVFDMSGQGRTLSLVGDPLYNKRGLAPYAELDGTGDWFSRVDEPGLDILASEVYVKGSIRGITLGGWVWFDNAAGVQEIFMSKWDAGANRSYLLRRLAAGTAEFRILDGGAVVQNVIGATLAAGQWYHLQGQLDRVNNVVRIHVNGVETTAAVPGATVIANSNAPFQIGANNGTNPMTGRVSNCFLAATALSVSARQTVYHQSRALYSVR